MNDIARIAKFIFEDVHQKPVILESGLSKLYNYALNFDCAIISASRGDPFDTTNCAIGKTPGLDEVTKQREMNIRRDSNRQFTKKYDVNRTNTNYLRTELMQLGYEVIPVRGAYIEGFNTTNAFRVAGNSFFVVNKGRNPKFNDDIIKLGEKYCQDSVLLSPKGARDAFLYGTNNASFPGYSQTAKLGRLFVGDPEGEEQFHTRISDRPFSFKETKPQAEIE